MNSIRKPIQISTLRLETSNSFETQIVALCDDGSIWTMTTTDNQWVALPPIPQGVLREGLGSSDD